MFAPLHIATHGEVPSEPDGLPRLLLDDGSITIVELDSVRCTSPFIVLSTCSSGEGRVYIGEGTLSLAHSFLRGGAKAVVQTLWPVDDQATSEILGQMYMYMENRLSADEALAKAKRAFVKNHADDALSNPFYWSGIVFTGSEVRPPERSRWIWWTSGAALLLAAVGYRSFRRSRRPRALPAN
ncbi:MAG: CHAT domain-containing protein [Flavobacteriales bacterium]|nr:CHAT domain-containing protein [Flavobacteriales bacterium]